MSRQGQHFTHLHGLINLHLEDALRTIMIMIIKGEKNSKNYVKLPVVHETVTAVSHLELVESRQASSRATLEEMLQEWGHKTRMQARLQRARTSNGGEKGLC